MKSHQGQDFPIQALFGACQAHPLHSFFLSVSADNIDTFDHECMFYLMYDGQPTVRLEHIDHLHPRSLLVARDVELEKMNSIANLALLDYATNIRKSNEELAAWLNNPNAVPNRQTYIKRHLIPDDGSLWTISAFDKFLSARARMIADKINQAL